MIETGDPRWGQTTTSNLCAAAFDRFGSGAVNLAVSIYRPVVLRIADPCGRSPAGSHQARLQSCCTDTNTPRYLVANAFRWRSRLTQQGEGDLESLARFGVLLARQMRVSAWSVTQKATLTALLPLLEQKRDGRPARGVRHRYSPASNVCQQGRRRAPLF